MEWFKNTIENPLRSESFNHQKNFTVFPSHRLQPIQSSYPPLRFQIILYLFLFLPKWRPYPTSTCNISIVAPTVSSKTRQHSHCPKAIYLTARGLSCYSWQPTKLKRNFSGAICPFRFSWRPYIFSPPPHLLPWACAASSMLSTQLSCASPQVSSIYYSLLLALIASWIARKVWFLKYYFSGLMESCFNFMSQRQCVSQESSIRIIRTYILRQAYEVIDSGSYQI